MLHALVVLIALLPAVALADMTGQASVIDGDTIEVHGTRIRLHGIDAPTTDPVGTLFRAADRDGNGAIDGREAGAAGAWLFADIYEDRDGGLSLSDITMAPGRLTTRPTWAEGKRLATQLRDAGRRMDRDANGWISHWEFHGFAAYLYWVADTDQSGTITRTELDSFLQVYVENESRLEPHTR